ncbi:DUF192 domain-containing protein [Ancylobacter defluvii]|uniref:DUF192 domain-containing protein n=1 Tax=Ancylobacter defluvii TaxID=1282440 RepID=A0A9W6NB50_9HYPH|nr:DUF192 domain-containing protein [Ancylobacter defluvii]MBS7585788.1 DUF192 domain-containing protein [Ancylobacter defluvii]GLK84161.1 hypothetical protein GCM10017653_22310 [Ancylobacter defluvii]
MIAPFRLSALPAAVLALGILLVALAPQAARAASFEKATIITRSGPVTFDVEIAVNAEERAKGLMYRTELAANTGMLFDFAVSQPVYMWMKNTYIPLDMLFIRADGRIARIAADTTPLSTQTIESGEPVRGVLELPAGTAKARGIAVGDHVQHRFFTAK